MNVSGSFLDLVIAEGECCDVTHWYVHFMGALSLCLLNFTCYDCCV